jgi:hypothetical protein
MSGADFFKDLEPNLVQIPKYLGTNGQALLGRIYFFL